MPGNESITGVLVRGRFVDGRFVEDGEPPPPPDPSAELGDYLRESASLLQRAGAASQAYLQAWTDLLDRTGSPRR